VSDPTLRIVLYALLAGLSPLALLSTLAVLGSGRGRANGIVFAIAFLVTQSIVLLLVVLLGSAATPGDRSHDTVASALELTLGLGLLGLGWRGRRAAPKPETARRSRIEGLLGRLDRMNPTATFSVGALLGIGGIKRLTITLFAGTTIALAALLPVEEFGLGSLYVGIAGLLVWAPVAVYLVAGDRADGLAKRARSWLATNEQAATSVSMIVFGALLAGDAVARLV
jgi:hypothetical protein